MKKSVSETLFNELIIVFKILVIILFISTGIVPCVKESLSTIFLKTILSEAEILFNNLNNLCWGFTKLFSGI